MIDPQRPDYSNTPVAPGRAAFDYEPADASARPCVSIVTPFFNTGAIFHETARSLYSQSLQQWEWIIVNDGSTDPESLAILNGFRERDPRIRVIDHPANRGLSAARNTGFAAARSDYVLQLDSDDLLEATAAEKWWWFLESHPEFAFVKGYHVGFGASQYLWSGGFHETLAFLDENRADATSLIRRAVHAQVGGYREDNRDGLEDWDFWLHCASEGFWGATVPEFLGWYRRQPGRTSRWRNWDNRHGERAFREQLRGRYPTLWTGAFPRIEPRPHAVGDVVRDELPAENRLRKRRSRLLMIVPWLVVGGVESFNVNAIAGLTKRGWEVTVVTTLRSDHPWLPRFARHTPDVFVLDRFLHPTDYPRFLRYLLGSRQPDAVLVSNSEFGYHLLPFLRAHAPDAAFVDFTHSVEEWKNGGYPRMAVEAGDLLDLNVAASCQVAQWMTSQGAPRARVRVCYVNVDTERWRPDLDLRRATRARLKVPESTPLILVAARIAPEKQPGVIARVLEQLQDQGVDYSAVIAGDGPDLPSLRSMIADKGLGGRVHFTGAAAPETVRELMGAADIFFLPSQREGIALSCFEAMSCSLAVVTADVGGQAELIVPGTGILVPRGSEDEEVERYTAALASLLASPDERASLGRNARARVCDTFRVEQMSDRLSGALREAIAAHANDELGTIPRAVASAAATLAVEFARVAEEADAAWRARKQAARATDAPGVAWITELQGAKRWLEEQWEAWERTAEARAQMLTEMASEKQWLEEQRDAWRNAAGRHEQGVIQLQEDKQWLEEQRNAWQHTAEAHERTIAEMERRIATLDGAIRDLEAANAEVRVDRDRLEHAGQRSWRRRLRARLGLEDTAATSAMRGDQGEEPR